MRVKKAPVEPCGKPGAIVLWILLYFIARLPLKRLGTYDPIHILNRIIISHTLAEVKKEM